LQERVIEDDARIASFIVKGLSAEGYSAAVAPDGNVAVDMFLKSSSEIDLVLLDLGLPGLSGEEVLARLKVRNPAVPVIILTARGATEDKVRGLNLGATDYVTKPFSFAELVARIRAAVRSTAHQVSTELVVNDLRLDLLTKVATRGDRNIELAPREWSLLELFMRHPTHLLSRSRILNEVFGYDFDVGSNIVDVYVGYLRRKLNGRGEESLIQTVRGSGYRFISPSESA
jgi:DNA-binding response OmpR family regulator